MFAVLPTVAKYTSQVRNACVRVRVEILTFCFKLSFLAQEYFFNDAYYTAKVDNCSLFAAITVVYLSVVCRL